MKKRKAYVRWYDELRSTSPFVIMCGVVAIIYFFYRIALVMYPLAVLEQSALHPRGDSSIVCGEEEGSHLQDPSPILSSDYQQRVKEAKALGPNLVTNPDITAIDTDTDQPIGYSHNIDTSTSQYQFLQDPTDLTNFLRMINSDTSSASAALPAWLADPVTINPESSYSYSFQYRSNVPITVALETNKNGLPAPHNQAVVTLKPSTTWQELTASYDNTDDMTQLRMVNNRAKCWFY